MPIEDLFIKSHDVFVIPAAHRIPLFLIVALLWYAFAPSSSAQATQSAEEGLYTSAQAAQGKKLYSTRCAAGHGADLMGLSAPPLTGPQFERNWISTTNLDDLFYLIRTSMPVGMAKSLSVEQHAAIFAYALEQNGYPAGNKPVEPDTPRSNPRGL